jgi:hypothetical protein
MVERHILVPLRSLRSLAALLTSADIVRPHCNVVITIVRPHFVMIIMLPCSEHHRNMVKPHIPLLLTSVDILNTIMAHSNGRLCHVSIRHHVQNITHRLRTRRVWRSLSQQIRSCQSSISDINKSQPAAHFENFKRSYLGHLSTYGHQTSAYVRT